MTEVSFGEWLKRQRMGRGLTQEQLARQIGCAAITLRKIEAEERHPSTEIVDQLIKIFEIPQNEKDSFLKFSRGDWGYMPAGVTGEFPWQADERAKGDQPRIGLATFLFTDIEGSSKLWDKASEKMKIALQRHHQILEGAVASNGGKVFQIIGDAFCAAFPTTLAAIAAAVTAQRELHQEQWGTPFPLRVRMGIHTGEAEQISGNPLLGDYASNPTLNRVARILSAAHGGQILLSLATTDLVKDILPTGTTLRDMGEHHLRNLTHPEHLFQLNVSGLPAEFPPLNTLTRRHNLPLQMTSFIGREEDMERIQDYLSREDIRLVTLMGAGGMGKTRLSIEVGRRLLPEFSDGVFFVALAPLSDPNLIARVVAQVLGFVETGNFSTEQQLREGIGNKQLLLILDNCEHLIDAVTTLVTDLLSSCPRIKIIATSREWFRIPGEWVYAVPGFDIPKEASTIDEKLPALMLFTERARAVQSDFALTTENIKTISAICARLDGLPLAIELIATQMRLMPPQALLERLSGQFVLSVEGMRTVSVRQKTLHDVIGWSYSLLTGDEQKLFAYLSVFSGGLTLDAAEAMFSGTLSGKSISNLVASLLDKSLLQRVPTKYGDARYTMLVMIREFARERLRNMGQEAEISNLHLEYFLALGERADQEIHGPDQVGWIDFVEAESNNFRAALEWSVSKQDAESALRLLCAVVWPWRLRGRYKEARMWFDNIRALPNVRDYPAIYARLLSDMGHSSWTSENVRDAYSFLNESQQISLLLDVDGEQRLAETLNWLYLIVGSEGSRQAKSMLGRALELNKKWDNQRGMALTLFHLGLDEKGLDHPEQAFSFLEGSLTLFRRLEDLFFIARVSGALGDLFLEQGSHDRARHLYEQSLEIDEELQYWNGIGTAYSRLGRLYLHQGDYDQAEQYFEKTLAIGREHGRGLGDTTSLYLLGLVALGRNNYLMARVRFVEYFETFRKGYDKGGESELFVSLAAIAAGMNQPERAAKLYGAAQASFEATYRVPSIELAEFERHMQIAQAQLGEEKFEQLISEGRAMTMEQAIAFALEN